MRALGASMSTTDGSATATNANAASVTGWFARFGIASGSGRADWKRMLDSVAGMKRYVGCFWFGVLLASVLVSCGGESRDSPDTSQRECKDVQDASIARLAEADTHVTGECRFQSECRLFTGHTECVYGCGFVTA